ncbi:hypothetical protein GE09DRAFT_1077819 [Coniochaeta sp. 2T2.1]|nr:hypothetical protein GE09DRAFT_1077819 [Coniochaeta sp. 2T2.1]
MYQVYFIPFVLFFAASLAWRRLAFDMIYHDRMPTSNSAGPDQFNPVSADVQESTWHTRETTAVHVIPSGNSLGSLAIGLSFAKTVLQPPQHLHQMTRDRP